MSLSLLATTATTLSLSSTTSLTNKNLRLSSTNVAINNRIPSYTSCEQKQTKEGEEIEPKIIDRRNVLLGLGGLYGATTTLGLNTRPMTAIANPVQPPDLSKCHLAYDTSAKVNVQCCPPYSSANIIPFVPPSDKEQLRIRKAAHKLDEEYIAKFKEGIAKMKALPDDDPWSFYQQATIHCTFCNGAFDQVGFDPAVALQVHGSFLFLPWHRYYLYFFERIIGKLIHDPTFALPFWNWDTPEGMRMPKFYYEDTSSPLYNDLRNHDHYTGLFDLSYSYSNNKPNPTPEEERDVIVQNLKTIINLFDKENLISPSLFMGKPVSAGVKPTDSAGGMESVHNVMHQWVGPVAVPHHDMGNFYTAGRDTLFYAHHGNCDRLWDIFSNFRGNRPEFKSRDYLDAAFIFYDENRNVVKCKISDCLMPQQLRYSYQPESLIWMEGRRRYLKWKKENQKKSTRSLSLETVSEFGSQPRALTDTIKAIVTRPKISRTKDDKEEEVEILVIENIEIPPGTSARFDVYVAKPVEGLASSDNGELVGSFIKVPHSHSKSNSGRHKSSIEFGLSTLLEDIGAEASEKVIVTLVPRDGDVTIGGLHIELSKVEEDED